MEALGGGVVSYERGIPVLLDVRLESRGISHTRLHGLQN
jgi:hypothetical protein